MNELAIYRGLFWKEWKDNGRLFGLGFILIAWQNLFYPIFHWLLTRNGTSSASTYFREWALNLRVIMNPGDFGTGPMVSMGIIMAIAFGVLLLSHERSSSLEFLVSTPVSRKEIIVGKFLAGASALFGIMLIHTTLVLAALFIGPAVPVSRLEVAQWSVFITVAWICLFSLSLLVSTLCRNFAVAGIATLMFMSLPGIAGQFACQIATHFFDPAGKAALKIYNVMNYLQPWGLFTGQGIPRKADSVDAGSSFYIMVGSGGELSNVKPLFDGYYPYQIAALLIVTLLFLSLAIWLFNRNPLERKGDLLMFGNFKQVAIIFVTFLIAWVRALDSASTLLAFVGYFILYFAAIYILFILFTRFIALFRIREWLSR
ncbi:MAG TPA: ABC transporter permease subunit [Syntrophomonadaceae bacterium]|nr:ABC transporter permease subunit [Syntrophomonadaceae bacterium]